MKIEYFRHGPWLVTFTHLPMGCFTVKKWKAAYQMLSGGEMFVREFKTRHEVEDYIGLVEHPYGTGA